MKKDRILTLFSMLLFSFGLGAIGWVALKSYNLKQQLENDGELACVTGHLDKVVKDEFMLDLIPQGSSPQVLLDYYRCNPVKRDDLVYFRFSAPVSPAIRKVYGLPGDQFTVEAGEQPKTFTLKINGKAVSTSAGKLTFQSASTPPLKSFEIARQGILGPNEFIILGEKQPAPNDSISLGAVKLNSFEGKVKK